MEILDHFSPNKLLKRRIEKDLLDHFSRIGIIASQQTWEAETFRRREGNEKVSLRKLASLCVHMDNIPAIEVWRETRKRGHTSTTQDELVYKIPFRGTVTLRRIPILTSTTFIQTADKKNFEWTGFAWGKLPLLLERLREDKELNDRLQEIFDEDMLAELRVRALSDDNVDIVSEYDSHRLPPRKLLNCIEEIAKHVISFVTEQNQRRNHADEMVRQKLFGSG